MMTDEPASNIWDTARFLKLSADMEHDDPEQAPAFKRDQQLTDAALFKAKVLAVLRSDLRSIERMQESDYAGGAYAAIKAAIVAVEGLPL